MKPAMVEGALAAFPPDLYPAFPPGDFENRIEAAPSMMRPLSGRLGDHVAPLFSDFRGSEVP